MSFTRVWVSVSVPPLPLPPHPSSPLCSTPYPLPPLCSTPYPLYPPLPPPHHFHGGTNVAFVCVLCTVIYFSEFVARNGEGEAIGGGVEWSKGGEGEGDLFSPSLPPLTHSPSLPLCLSFSLPPSPHRELFNYVIYISPLPPLLRFCLLIPYFISCYYIFPPTRSPLTQTCIERNQYKP